MIKAIIFDCFGVLYVHRGPEFLRTYAVNYQEVKPQLKDLSNQTDYGLISQQEYVKAVAELTGLNVDEVNAHSERGFGRNDELMDYIAKTLRPQYKIGLLSNISRGTMDNYFSEQERSQLFDAAALSSETGMIKPNMDAFEHICELLGVDTSEAIMVDDNADNCHGAVLAGMRAIDYDGLVHLRRSLETKLPKK